MLNPLDIDRLLKLFAKYDMTEELHWNNFSWVEQEDGTMKCLGDVLDFYILCNDVFYWGCSDGQSIENSADIDLLEQAIKDTSEDAYGSNDGPLLYVARKRGLRPQGAMYKHIEERNRHWFDEAGPEREIDFSNPISPEGEYKYKSAVEESREKKLPLIPNMLQSLFGMK